MEAARRILPHPGADAHFEHDVRAGQDVPVQVFDVLPAVPDGRGRRCRRHELATVLLVAVAAVLAGARSLAGIAGWASGLPLGAAAAGHRA